VHYWDSHKPVKGSLHSLSFNNEWKLEIVNNGNERVFLDHVNFKLGAKGK